MEAAIAASVQNPKLVWFIQCASLTIAPAIYYVVGTQVARSIVATPSLPMLRTVFRVLAPLGLIAGGFLLTRAPRARADVGGLAAFFGGEEPATPVAFQTAFIIASAMVGSCSIYGFVLLLLGAPLGEYLPYGAGTIAILLAIAMPKGLRYWAEHERGSIRAGGSSPIE